MASCYQVSVSSWPAGWEAGSPRKKPNACPSHSLFLLSTDSLTTTWGPFLPMEAFGQPSRVFLQPPGALPVLSRHIPGPGPELQGEMRVMPGTPPCRVFPRPRGSQELPPPPPEMEKAGQTANIWPLGSAECEKSGLFSPTWKKESAWQSRAARSRAALPGGEVGSRCLSKGPSNLRITSVDKDSPSPLKAKHSDVMFCGGEGCWRDGT